MPLECDEQLGLLALALLALHRNGLGPDAVKASVLVPTGGQRGEGLT